MVTWRTLYGLRERDDYYVDEYYHNLLYEGSYISRTLEQDEIAERELRAERYLWHCLAVKIIRPWRWWFRRLVGGVWQ